MFRNIRIAELVLKLNPQMASLILLEQRTITYIGYHYLENSHLDEVHVHTSGRGLFSRMNSSDKKALKGKENNHGLLGPPRVVAP